MLKKGGKWLGYQVNVMERTGDEKNVEEWEDEQTQQFNRDSGNECG